MTNSDYFQRDSHVSRINAKGSSGNHSSHNDDEYFRHDAQVARINADSTSDDEPTEKIDAIRENMMGPKRVTGDAGSVEQHSLKDQIEAEWFLASKEATKRPGLGIRLTKLVPDGTT